MAPFVRIVAVQLQSSDNVPPAFITNSRKLSSKPGHGSSTFFRSARIAPGVIFTRFELLSSPPSADITLPSTSLAAAPIGALRPRDATVKSSSSSLSSPSDASSTSNSSSSLSPRVAFAPQSPSRVSMSSRARFPVSVVVNIAASPPPAAPSRKTTSASSSVAVRFDAILNPCADIV